MVGIEKKMEKEKEEDKKEEASVDAVVSSPSVVRPEDMIPAVHEYLGLKGEKDRLEEELKRCFQIYKMQRNRLLEKKKPINSRIQELESELKKMMITNNLPGFKFKRYIFSLEEKAVFKPPADKIAEALERTHIENYSHNKKGLANLLADAVKKKVRETSQESRQNMKNMVLKMRIQPGA
jgi:hypothetical protein